MITKKAIKAIVNLGSVEIEGLMLPDGKFAISMTQLAELVNYDANHISRKLSCKQALSIVPQGFQNYQITVEGYKNKAKVIMLEELNAALMVLALTGIKEAANIVGLLSGLALQQLFCDAFQIKFEVEERIEWLQERTTGKVVRRTLTDAIKDYLETNETPEEYQKWVYANATELVNLGIFNRRANQLRRDWDCKNPRDEMTKDELRWVLQVEELAMRLIDNDGLEPIRAVREAVSRLCIPVVRR